MSDELDALARRLRENPPTDSPTLDEIYAEAEAARLRCRDQHKFARYDAASNTLWCPSCCEDV